MKYSCVCCYAFLLSLQISSHCFSEDSITFPTAQFKYVRVNKGFKNSYLLGSMVQWGCLPLASVTTSFATPYSRTERTLGVTWSSLIGCGLIASQTGSTGMLMTMKRLAEALPKESIKSHYHAARIFWILGSAFSATGLSLWIVGSRFDSPDDEAIRNTLALSGYGSLLTSQILTIPIAVRAKKARDIVNSQER